MGLGVLLLAGCSDQVPVSAPARSREPSPDTAVVATVIVVAPASGASRSAPEPQDAWSGCVDEQIRKRELEQAPTGSVAESTGAVTRACRALYRGKPGQDELAIDATIAGIRAKTTLTPTITNARRN
jgi:hypothetical protein